VAAQLGVLAIDVLQHVELVALLFGCETLVDEVLDRLVLKVFDLESGVPDRRALVGAR